MLFKLVMHEPEDGRTVTIEQGGLEHIDDVAELLLNFVRAVGYDYVRTVVLIKGDGSEASSM